MDCIRDMTMWDGESDARRLSEQGVEVWAPAPNGRGIYFISNLGRYCRRKPGETEGLLLRGSQSSTGYILFSLTFGDFRQSIVAHRMVLTAFDGPPPSPEHTDGGHLGVNDKTDNRLCNLAWQTRSENMRQVAEARRLGTPTSRTSVAPRANPTYSLQESRVTTGIRLFAEKKLNLAEVAMFWDVSVEVARPILVGTTWRDVPRDLPAIMARLGREGEVHHKATVSDEELQGALQQYTDNRWSGVSFAAHLGISQATAHSILSGRTRAKLPRPTGFQYPWPEAATMNKRVGSDHGCSKLTDADVASLFDRVVAGEFESVKAIEAAFPVGRSVVYAILRGTKWSHVPQPPELADALAKIMRPPKRAKAEVDAIVDAILVGDPREEVIARFGLGAHQYDFYLTKANKMKSRADGNT